MNAVCSCGGVEIEAIGTPIASTVCYCDDCQAAALQIEAMPGAPPFRQSDGGTPFVVYRKDRVRYIRGEEFLTKLKLRDDSATNRNLARCCSSVMVLDFDDSKHWVDIYGARVQGAVPRPEMLVCTRFAPNAPANASNALVYPGYSGRLMLRLLAARVAMVFTR
jgi:hypothetical protein